MAYVQSPTGLIWRQVGNRISGTVQVPSYAALNVADLRLDAVARVTTGDTLGLLDCSLNYLGDDFVAFDGEICEIVAEDLKEVWPTQDLFWGQLQRQYSWTAEELAHAKGALDRVYCAEMVLPVQGSARAVCFPAAPASCDYIRVVSDGYEIGCWDTSAWSEGQKQLLQAMLLTARGQH